MVISQSLFMDNSLFRKKGLDAVLENLNNSDGMGRVPDPTYDARLYGKGTELESNRTPPVSLPPTDFKQARVGDLVEEFSAILDRYGYRLAGPRSDGNTLWMRGPKERVTLDTNGDWVHSKNNVPDLSGNWRELEDKMDNYHEFTRTLVTASEEVVYHVTHTKLVPKIKKQGILPMQTSNWSEGRDGGRYGAGWIFAFDNEIDAIRWAGKMDWEFNQKMGSGKISIVTLTKDDMWEPDVADPISQAGANGNWLKRFKKIPPQEIKSLLTVTPDVIRKAVLKPSEPEEKEAATKSYGTGTPIGGTPNTPQQWTEEGEEEGTDKLAAKFNLKNEIQNPATFMKERSWSREPNSEFSYIHPKYPGHVISVMQTDRNPHPYTKGWIHEFKGEHIASGITLHLLDKYLRKRTSFQLKAELLRKADVDIHTTPPIGAPREDQRTHVDEELENEIQRQNNITAEPQGMTSFRQF
jgi:hypothetical protein